mgnify:CR=1 FL=1
MIFYNEKGEYLIHQYANGKAYKTVRVIVVSQKDYDMSINSIKYGDKLVGMDSLMVNDSNLIIDVAENKYGYEKNVDVSVNECAFSVKFSGSITINKSKFQSCLIHNGNNKLNITLYNGFGKSKVFKYSFNLASEKITINLENSVSEIVTSIAFSSPALSSTFLNPQSTGFNGAYSENKFMKDNNIIIVGAVEIMER